VRIAFGVKAHSGWAALVAIGAGSRGAEVIDRRRVELVSEADASWAKQPYHAAETLPMDEARKLVQRGHEGAHRHAVRALRQAFDHAGEVGHAIAGCAVLVGEPMPTWSVAEILAVHVRMHRAEGALFREALVRAAAECGVEALPIREKELILRAQEALAAPWRALLSRITALGKSAGPPWGKDQKQAALAALIALTAASRTA
jgi:hypothetical protein